ncbi:hypothetical protein GCM10017557_33580 [Streptomyces aurantiacus]|uniref:Uncharacterized protein n=1 Tax=Streptomyces aurantiacus TaxID=47760 RepID=A0A7G1NZU3_9ACTN|nr:hypothetical protein GCM10017557_33580 [Streptomyces aurantiacus]
MIALLMPSAIHPEIPPVPSPPGTSAGGIGPAVGTEEADGSGCGMQSDAEHEDSVLDGVGAGSVEAVGAGAGPGLGLGSA